MNGKMYTKVDIFNQLEAIDAPKDSVVLMHSSLRAIGEVEGGAQGLLDALVEYFTAEGGLFCVPTHTWDSLDKEITVDMAGYETCLGGFSVVALRDGRGVRSESPTHSMVVFGERERVEEFIADEPFIKSPTSADSCYGKLCSMGGKVMLVGVAHNRNTYIHCVDEMLNIPGRMTSEPIKVRVKRADGEVIEREIFFYQNDFVGDISLRFVKYETPFRYHGCIKDGFLGNAPVQLCDARKMKDTVELIFKNSGCAEILNDELPVPPRFYCNK